MCSILDISCRVSCPTLIRRYIFRNNTASTDNRSFSYGNRIADNHIAANKCILLNYYPAKVVVSSFFFRVKEMCKNGCVLCYGNPFTYGYKVWCDTVEIYIAVDPTWPLSSTPPSLTNFHLW